jgi:pyrimidine oxygenase
MLGEYAQILRELFETGVSDFKGEYFEMTDCRVSPKPQADMKIICAGSSDEGLAFAAQYADYTFCFGKGVNTPTAFRAVNERLARRRQDRAQVDTFVLMIIADETDEAAEAKWLNYCAGADRRRSSGCRTSRRPTMFRPPPTRQMSDATSAVNINMGTLVGLCQSRGHARRNGRSRRPAACC